MEVDDEGGGPGLGERREGVRMTNWSAHVLSVPPFTYRQSKTHTYTPTDTHICVFASTGPPEATTAVAANTRSFYWQEILMEK